MAAANTIQGWRLPIRPLSATSLCCGGIHIHYVARLAPSLSVSLFLPLLFFFFAVYLYLFLQLSPLSGSSFLSLSMPLWASPGLVAVGSTRASHTVT